MKSLTLLFCALFMFALTSNAQTKVDNALNKANTSLASTNNSVNNAGTTATNAANTATTTVGTAKSVANTFGSLFGKKPADGTVNTTQISVKGIKFAALKKLNESIMDCSGVQDSKMKFGADGSTITVSHVGSTAKLLKSIQKKSDMITDDNIDNFDEGKIEITIK
ncbi:MAG TPA: hypothetical protein VK668_23575 [Mucilaginibacter sp.]|nr:hypothetical protein [Mucilaginibacter sp.]